MFDTRLHRAALALALLVLPAVVAACAADEAADETPAALTVTASLEVETPGTGQHTLTITVRDADGHAVLGATVGVEPEMPMHGHGSSETPVVTEVGDGVYSASPVTFQMPGMWTVTVTATKGAQTGSVALDYQVN